MRVPLSISPDYVNWSWWECIRELFQNGIDSHTLGNTMRYSYSRLSKRLIIHNDRSVLARETLVLGVSSKRGDDSQRGGFGEGYKLAVSVLLRLGATITIFNGNEVWTPELAFSDQFNSKVLFFSMIPSSRSASGLTFVITGVPEEEWERAQSRLLFLSKYPEHIKTSKLCILTDPQYSGKLFVKGIYVSDLSDKHTFGYDISKISLNRDRQAPDPYAFKVLVSSAFKEAVVSGALPAQRLFDILEKGGGEASAFDADWVAASKFEELLCQAFDSKYGADSIPVSNPEEAQRVADWSLTGVQINPSLLRLLRRVKSSVEKIAQSGVYEISRQYTVRDLSEQEKESLRWAISLVSQYESVDLNRVHVVDFRTKRLLGMYRGGDVFLDRRVLADRYNLIATLVHEVCHKYGIDGSQIHRNKVEDTLGKIIVHLYEKIK